MRVTIYGSYDGQTVTGSDFLGEIRGLRPSKFELHMGAYVEASGGDIWGARLLDNGLQPRLARVARRCPRDCQFTMPATIHKREKLRDFWASRFLKHLGLLSLV